MNQNFTTFAFTDSVKAVQAEQGSRKSYAQMEQSGDRYVLTQSEIDFIESRDSFYISTVGDNGWPYVQHRGGPKGFLKVLDDTTLAMADFRGNMQYISTGNINASHKAALILMDYPTRQRLKIWATSEVLEIEAHPELFNQTMNADYRASAERLMTFKVQAYDWNCQQHITPRYTLEEIETLPDAHS
jgi:predicted pyridoxine 5'-phosphate oxidase superfamily flavin-nucleotide-binding protein